MNRLEGEKGKEGVSVITATHRPEMMDHLLDNYLRQEYPLKELIVILNNNRFNLARWRHKVNDFEDITVFHMPTKVSLGHCYNFAVQQARYQLLAKFDDDDYYSSQYLNDALNLFQCTNADIVGKLCRFIYFSGLSTLALYCPGPEYEFVSYVVGATLIIKKKVFATVQFPNLTYGEDSEFQKACLKEGFNIYAGDRYNYVTIRQPDAKKHTYKITDKAYLAYCRTVANTSDYVPYIDASARRQI